MLTEREGAAILASNWPEVRRCQEAKQQLQPAIIRSTTASATSSTGVPRQQENELQKQIRAIVNELIRLESENNSVLQKRMASLEDARGELDQTAGRLRRVHRSYGRSPNPAWNQYS